MTSKTFKSAVSAGHLNIHDSKRGLITVSISRDKAILEMIDLKTETAPALALAILEAAGYDDMADDANLADVHAFNAMHKLQESVDTQERATAEAKEQAELEAEALELLNAYRAVSGGDPLGTWRQAGGAQEYWLAVARKAREMRNP